MKLEKILAALIAGSCALTAAAVSVFAASEGESSDAGSDAGTSPDGSVGESVSDPVDSDLVDDDTPAYIYTWNVPASESEESGWVSTNITQSDLIGSVKPSDVEAIVLKGASADDQIGIGFNTTLTDTKAEGYFQTNDDDENWPSNTVTVRGSDVDWDNYYVQLFSNLGEATTVTVSVYSSADDTSDDTSSDSDASSDSDSASDSASDSDSGDASSGGLVEDSSNVTNNSGAQNPGTGIAMTFAPAVIAAAAVIASKKRK
ncbi:MAG: hypothetical protein NC401_17750 [Ruminococcus sp.]|nr:hypothetical protein [Ruminococcus sp.]